MPESYREGILESFYPFVNRSFVAEHLSFGQSIVRTMQNRNFEALMRMPGYRERVVHVRLAPGEGGINLGMTPEQITALAQRGRGAGRRLVEAFNRPSRGGRVSWDAHRWTRLRSTLVALEQLHLTIATGLTSKVEPTGARDYMALLNRADEPPTNYPVNAALRELAIEELDAVEESAERIRDSGTSFAEDAPKPKGKVRIARPMIDRS